MSARNNFESLSEFVALLEQKGELVRIRRKVSPVLEITEITDRVSKSPGGGKALLFENVEGAEIPVLINAFGSRDRMAMSLGVTDLEDIAKDLEQFIHMKAPESLGDKLGMAPMLWRMTRFPPRVVNASNPPCQEEVHTGGDIDIGKLPILKCWPDDGGRFITLPCVITKSLDGKRNVGVYRMQEFNHRSTGMHWHIHKDGAAFYNEYREAGRRMEVAVAIGADPAVVFSATAPMPYGMDELLLAGFIRNKPVELVKCVTVDLEAPKHAEIVLEGFVEPGGDMRTEGPFGDHTGYYSLTGDYPVFHITAVTHKKNPIYLTTIVGKPPMEDCYMGKATERIFLPLLKTVNPDIADYDLPWEGVFHNCVIMSVKKRYPAQSNKLMSSLWGAGQMAFAKMIVAVDEKVDVHDYELVAQTLLDRIDIENGLVITEGILDVLDHSSPKPLQGAKLGIDVTTPIGVETGSTVESWADRDTNLFTDHCKKSESIVACAIPYKSVASPLAIISVKKEKPFDGRNIAHEAVKADTANSIRIALVVEENIDPTDYSTALWKFFNNVDPRRDILHENGRLIIDATNKMEAEGHPREWPDEMVMDKKTIASVDAMWDELGI